VNLPELAVCEVAPPAAEPRAGWLYDGGASRDLTDDGCT
jgi:hypothetical protein